MVKATRAGEPEREVGDYEPPGNGMSAQAARGDAAAAGSASDMLTVPRCPVCRLQLVPRVRGGAPRWLCGCDPDEAAARRAAAWTTPGLDLPADEPGRQAPREYLLPQPLSPRLRRLLGMEAAR